MADKMEGLLAQTIIEATKVSQTDIALERMTNHAVKANLNAQVNLARFQQGVMHNLERDVDSLKMDIKSTNNEKRLLQDKLRIALEMYEEANSNTGSWIDLLNKPFHEIAEKHQGFSESYTDMMGNFSKIVLKNMTQTKTIDFMAEKLEYTPLDVEVIQYRFEGEVLNEQQKNKNQEYKIEDELIKSFITDLIKENKTKYDNIKKKVAKSSKTYK